MDEILNFVGLIYFLVKKFSEKFPQAQIGKTVIQKIMYIFEAEQKKYNFDFSLYHYGPYSPLISHFLNLAEDMDLVEIKWDPQRGYFIKPKETDITNKTQKKILETIVEEDKIKIEEIINRYGNFEPIAAKLSIIATAIYLRENFNVSYNDIVRTVHSLKPQYTEEDISVYLKEGGILQ